jgi:hypothetical protein
MKHLTEEDLIEQAYGEGSGGVAQHLDGCTECAESLTELKSELAEFDRVEAPERGADYGEQVWRAIASSLPRYERQKQNWFGLRLMRGLAYAGVCAVMIVTAFYAGRKWEQRGQTIAQNAPQPKPKQPVVIVVLGDHLDRSERLLVELKHVDAQNRDMMPPLRDEARSLLTANRICRANAEKSGDPELEQALDRLDHLLTEVANQPGGLDSAAITRIKNELNADGLLFEVRVLRSRARDQKPAMDNRMNGGTA